MTRRRTSARSSRAAKRTNGPSGLAASGVLLVAALAAFLGWNARTGPPATVPEREAPQDDIFADVPDDVPPQREARTVTPLSGRGAALPTDVEAWNTATDYAQRAEVALKEALAAQEAGARDLARDRGHEAQELYTRALEAANPYLESLGASLGYDDPLVQRISKQTSVWAREVVFLKKSAGL